MKKAAKVFLILAMIFSFYFIFPIIIGSITINRINSAKRREDIIGWGIASLILVSTLGGIFTLCIRDEELAGTGNLSQKEEDSIEPIKEIESVDNALDYIKNIKELKELYDNGALSEEEYARLKSEQLKSN